MRRCCTFLTIARSPEAARTPSWVAGYRRAQLSVWHVGTATAARDVPRAVTDVGSVISAIPIICPGDFACSGHKPRVHSRPGVRRISSEGVGGPRRGDRAHGRRCTIGADHGVIEISPNLHSLANCRGHRFEKVMRCQRIGDSPVADWHSRPAVVHEDTGSLEWAEKIVGQRDTRRSVAALTCDEEACSATRVLHPIRKLPLPAD
jgi:hypothetical protein